MRELTAELHRFGAQEGHLAIFRGDQIVGIASFSFRSRSRRTPSFTPDLLPILSPRGRGG